MNENTLNKLKIASSFYDDLGFQCIVNKVYKNNNGVHGVQITRLWHNEYGNFSERVYLSKQKLLAKEYDDELVHI